MEVDTVNSMFDDFRKNIEENNLIQASDKILVLNSLGKDASVLMDLLLKYQSYVNFEIYSVVFCVPSHSYQNSKEVLEIIDYWKRRGQSLEVINFKNEDLKWEDIPADAENLPCDYCRNLRNEQMKVAINKYNPTKVFSGFNLTDIQNYLVTMMLISNFSFDANIVENDVTKERFNSLISRFFIDVKSNIGDSVRWILPLLIFEESKINNFVEKENIPYLKTKCKYKPEVARTVFADYCKKLHKNYEFNTDYNSLIEFLKNNIKTDINSKLIEYWLK